jgi:LmbE family N-acetylglucosaminyl deacetylase
LKRAAGVSVRVVILTDGEAVASGLAERPETVIAARKREALDACQRLGVNADSLRWLHFPDGKLPHPAQPGFDEATRDLLAEIEAFAPGEIYCPHLLDVRPDHIAATRLTHQALRLSSRPCAVFYFPVWMWYHASSGLRKRLNTTGAWRLDISMVQADKEHAMAAYLDAPKTPEGNPYCGRLPWSFLRNFRRKYEVYFPVLAGGAVFELPPRN